MVLFAVMCFGKHVKLLAPRLSDREGEGSARLLDDRKGADVCWRWQLNVICHGVRESFVKILRRASLIGGKTPEVEPIKILCFTPRFEREAF